MTLRLRIALGFAAVALVTAAVVVLATPHIVGQGFSELEQELEGSPTAAVSVAPSAAGTSTATSAAGEGREAGDENEAQAAVSSASSNVQQSTILLLVLVAVGAAVFASFAGFFAAARLTRPLVRLEDAAAAVARGDLSRRSGLAERSDEFGQLGRSFDAMAGELQRAEEARRGFLQDVAHELRTPLTVIDATSSAILDGVYPPERRHLETIRDQSRVLARIVDDLRTITLAEVGRLPLDRQPVDVRRVLEGVAAAFEARAAATGASIVVEAAPGLVADADLARFRQAIGALTDNGLRYTPRDGALRLVGTADGPGFVRVAVEDAGPGFPPDVLPHVFERFYQGDPSHSRRSGTSGLGLSIVRALVEAHGGRLGAENRAEGGARVWFELPSA